MAKPFKQLQNRLYDKLAKGKLLEYPMTYTSLIDGSSALWVEEHSGRLNDIENTMANLDETRLIKESEN